MWSYSLLFVNVTWTIVRILARKGVGMCLYTVRIKYLHNPTKVDALNKIVDVRMPNVVTEYEQSLLDPSRLCQRYDDMSKISKSRVNLHDDHRCIRRQRTECIIVIDLLLRIEAAYVFLYFTYFKIR